MFGQIDHIGIAVEDLERAVPLYSEVLGMREQHRETVQEQGVHAALLEVGNAHVELISPIGAEGSVARFLERNGPGLHHVAYRTENIDTELARLTSAGLRLVNKRPRVGICGTRVAFIHPESTSGVLTEIVELSRNSPGRR